MDRLLHMDVQVRERVYTKDPSSTELGHRIIAEGIRLIDELGFERFTMAKLAHALGTAEASVYRYFANKHRLLVYLVDWYWAWREIKLAFDTANIADKRERLERGLRSVTSPITERGQHEYVDLQALYRIATNESAKAWFTKDVEPGDKDGHFGSFVRLSHRLRDLILEAKPGHAYAHDLAALVLEGTGSLRFFHEQLPALFGKQAKGKDSVADMLQHLVFASIDSKRK
ncbi:MAG: TetR/AcrR family transcriptional regulator [Flavobacteriales bacterium]|nr:TetR/AcrR family transcriptional regulator [Flavobacteriales bacterium]